MEQQQGMQCFNFIYNMCIMSVLVFTKSRHQRQLHVLLARPENHIKDPVLLKRLGGEQALTTIIFKITTRDLATVKFD